MSAANGSAVPGERTTDSKGKHKSGEQPQSAQNHDMSRDEDEDTSEGEESGNEEPNIEEEVDEDKMEEIDTSNILSRRTRGKIINFAKAAEKAKEAGDTLDEDEDDDDEDFDEAEQGDGDKIEG